MEEFFQYSKKEMALFARQQPVIYRSPKFPKKFQMAISQKKNDPVVGKYFNIKRKNNWIKAKAVKRSGQKITFSYYHKDRIQYITLAKDSDDIKGLNKKQFSKSDKVEAVENGKWYAATILKKDPTSNLYFIHYDNYSKKYDCWLHYSDLRKKQK